jgi:hypothetical protein
MGVEHPSRTDDPSRLSCPKSQVDTCQGVHEMSDMTLVNTLGGRCGEVYECEDCGQQILKTPGLLVGGEKTRPLRTE